MVRTDAWATTPRALTMSLLELLEDAGLAASLGAAARATVASHFPIDAFRAELARPYRLTLVPARVCASRRARAAAARHSRW